MVMPISEPITWAEAMERLLAIEDPDIKPPRVIYPKASDKVRLTTRLFSPFDVEAFRRWCHTAYGNRYEDEKVSGGAYAFHEGIDVVCDELAKQVGRLH